LSWFDQINPPLGRAAQETIAGLVTDYASRVPEPELFDLLLNWQPLSQSMQSLSAQLMLKWEGVTQWH
jgi:hypothetical protein